MHRHLYMYLHLYKSIYYRSIFKSYKNRYRYRLSAAFKIKELVLIVEKTAGVGDYKHKLNHI